MKQICLSYWKLLIIFFSFHHYRTVAQQTAIIDYSYLTASSNYTNFTRRVQTNGLIAARSSQGPVINGRPFVLIDANSSYDACQPSVNVSDHFGGVAIVPRGGECTFSIKITRAKQLGAAAVIIFDPFGDGIQVINMVQNDTEVFSVYVQRSIGSVLFDLARNSKTNMTISLKATDLDSGFAGFSSPWFGTRAATIFIVISISILFFLCATWFFIYTCNRYRSRTAKDQLEKRLNNAAKKALGKIKLETISEGTTPIESCVVCLDGMKPGDVVRKLVCNHSFHQSCVDPWLLNHRHCPLCNLDILSAYRVSLSGRTRRCSVAPTPVVSSSIPTISSTIDDDGERIVALHSQQTRSNN